MKPSLFSLLILFFLASCNQKPASTNTASAPAIIDEPTELAAIMATIEAETKCFFQRDFDCWKNHWVNEVYAFQSWNNGDGTFDAANTFDTLAQRAQTYFKTNPVKDGKTASHEKVTRKNIVHKFYGDKVAYLFWDQYNLYNTNSTYNHSKDVRLMEKVGDQWKIVNVSDGRRRGRKIGLPLTIGQEAALAREWPGVIDLSDQVDTLCSIVSGFVPDRHRGGDDLLHGYGRVRTGLVGFLYVG